MRILLTTCTISRQPAGWFGALESLGPWDSAPQTMIPCVWQYGNMVILTIAPFYNVAPKPINTKPKSQFFFLLRIPLFLCSAKPCLAVRQMENSHGNGVEQRILADKRSSCITHTKPIKRSNQSQTAKFSRTCLDYKYHAKQLNQQNDQRTFLASFQWPEVASRWYTIASKTCIWSIISNHHHNKLSHPVHFDENPNGYNECFISTLRKNVVKKMVGKTPKTMQFIPWQFQTQPGGTLPHCLPTFGNRKKKKKTPPSTAVGWQRPRYFPGRNCPRCASILHGKFCQPWNFRVPGASNFWKNPFFKCLVTKVTKVWERYPKKMLT